MESGYGREPISPPGLRHAASTSAPKGTHHWSFRPRRARQPSPGDPVHDGAVADAEAAGHLGHGELAVFEQPGLGDLMVMAQVGDGHTVEGPARTGGVAGGIEPPGDARGC